jgi:hypothetical protein
VRFIEAFSRIFNGGYYTLQGFALKMKLLQPGYELPWEFSALAWVGQGVLRAEMRIIQG